ncbi:MAG: hypothetical protein ACI4XA_08570 [Oscillospiraceae bacterium]
MIKGVTRNIIEINNMDSKYFERAIVVLRNDCALPDEDTVKRELSLNLNGQQPSFINAAKITQRIKIAAAAAAGALISASVCLAVYMFV